MNSTAAFLRHGFSIPPPRLPTTASVAGRRLPLTFSCSVSSIRPLAEKWNEKYNNKYGRCNKNNNDMDIRCGTVRNADPSDTFGDRDKFPFPNTKMALQSLLCFSSDTATVEPHMRRITAEKERALKALLDEGSDEAERIMMNVYNEYHNSTDGQTKYDASLALIQILIYTGKSRCLKYALERLKEIARIKDKPNDARPLLYHAVIYTLLDQCGTAKRYWRAYAESIRMGPTGT
ncbi:unnamed protein product [Citrullus colocynthis]|uniref:Uncharacterized protein n=1 Tax=Citrullus colocynthis TaxID=252529 RepID=A0ABP0Z4G8_9ROSI